MRIEDEEAESPEWLEGGGLAVALGSLALGFKAWQGYRLRHCLVG